MEVLTKATGPGGTELLVRVTPSSSRQRPKLRPTVSLANERTACKLRQAVENARTQGMPEKLEKALHNRRQFWIDTCRDVLERQVASSQVLELHRAHGCRFRAPAARQVQDV